MTGVAISIMLMFLQSKALSLADCISRAIECDPGLKQSSLQLRRCREEASLQHLDWLPSVYVSAGNDFGWGRSVDMQELLIIDNRMNYTASLSASATLNLNELIKARSVNCQRKMFISEAEAAMELARSEIVIKVTGAYLELLLAEQVLETANKNLEEISRKLDESRKKIAAGTISEHLIAGMEAQAASEKAEVTDASGKMNIARMTLKSYLDLPPEEELIIIPPAEDFIEAPDTSRLLMLVSKWESPEIQAAEATLAADRGGCRAAGLAMLPVLSISGGYGSYYGNISNGSFRKQMAGNGNASLGISITIPILNGSEAIRNLRNASAKVRQDELEVEKIRKRVKAEIYSDAVGTSGLYENLVAAVSKLNAARSAYDTAFLKFGGGSIPDTEYFISHSNLKRSEAEYLQAKYRYMMQLKIIEYKYGIQMTDNSL